MVFFQDLWLLSVGIDNNPWGQYQTLIHIPFQGIYDQDVNFGDL